MGQVVILNYELLPNKWELNPGTTIVFDEAHYLKNNRSLRTQKARAVAKTATRCWLLTGTPLLNSPGELWNLLQVGHMSRTAFGSWNNFVRLFQGYKGQWGMEWGEPTLEASEGLYRVCLRRRKVDVLTDLPAKHYRQHSIRLKRGAIRKVDWDPMTFGTNDWSMPKLEKFSELYARISTAKIPAMLEIVEQHELNETPLVVFSQHRAPIDALHGRPGWMTITGDTPDLKRADAVFRFQAGKLLGLACTIPAASVGITLTHASNMLFVSRSFTPAINLQAEDRICRIGQISACQYTSIVSDHPLDARIEDVLAYKQDIVDSVIERIPEHRDVLPKIKKLREHTLSWLHNKGEG